MYNMQRYANWPDRLLEFISDRDKTGLIWGKSDCCLFACDAIQAMNGSDPGYWFREKYDTRKEAFKLLKRFGGGGLIETTERIMREMHYPEIKPSKANSGDLVLIDVENVHPDAHGLTAAIMVCPEVAIAQGKDRLVYVDHPQIERAWAI
tara:strand:- start:979 stop:1428 length:450 start_codon:yes stop_codon:yes gene_type:complete